MADMLSNTVGIMLFILAFTVLHTGGVLIPKRLPMEVKTDESPLYYVCLEQRLIPLNGELTVALIKKLGDPTYDTAEEWVDKFNKSRVEDEFFSIVTEGEARFSSSLFRSSVQLVLTAEYRPKPGVGETIGMLDQGDSLFAKRLGEQKKKDKFVYFFVYPDSLDIYRKAREYAKSHYDLGSGWSPMSEGKPIRFNLAGGGGRGISPARQ